MKYKPYPKYKDSGVEWLGEIPEGWRVLALKFGAQIELSNIDKHSSEGEPPVQLCNYIDVYRNERITSSLAFMQATASQDQIKRLTLKNGDVIITKDSETPDDIGISAFVEETAENLVCGYHLCLIRPNAKQFSGRLLHWFFSSHSAKAYFYTEAVGMTRFALGKYSIANTSVPLPPLPTQRAIAAFLDTETARIDGLIKDYEELIELLKEKRQALISHAVTRGLSELVSPDDPEFGEWAKPVKFKDSGIEWIGEIPEGWEVQKLNWLCEKIADGTHFSPESFPEGSFKYITAKNVKTNGFDFSDISYVPENVHQSIYSRCPVKKDDVLLIKDGATAGVVMINDLEEQFSMLSSVAMIRPNLKKVISSIIFYWLSSKQHLDEALSRLVGGAMTRFTLEMIGKFKIVVPSIDDQRTIAAFLDRETSKIDTLVSETESAIELLKEHRSALITNAVTGKINVEEYT